MQGFGRAGRRFLDAAALAGRLVRAGGMFAFLAAHRAAQDTVTQLIPAVRRVAREVPGAAGQIAGSCTGHDYGKPGKPTIGRDGPGAQGALVWALVNDAGAVVAAFAGAELDERAASAVALLALVAGQDAGPTGGSDGTGGRWRIARKAAGNRVIPTAGPDARHARRSPGAAAAGTALMWPPIPQTGIITGEKLTRASGEGNSDPAAAGESGAARAGGAGDRQRPGGAGEPGGGPAGDGLSWYGDPAYRTGELRDATGQAGHRAVIKPRPVQPAVPGGFTRDDFAIDDQAGTVTCPAGLTRTIPPRAACRRRRRLRRLPAALPVRHLQVRAGAQPAPARSPAARRPRRPGC